MISTRAQTILQSLQKREDPELLPAPQTQPAGKRPRPTPVQCSKCGADIFWIKTTAGADMPIDIKKYLIMIPESWHLGPKGRVTDAKWIAVSGYQCHFATCPQAAHFRKRDHVEDQEEDAEIIEV